MVNKPALKWCKYYISCCTYVSQGINVLLNCSVPTDHRSFRTSPKNILQDRSIQDLKIAKRTVWWMQFMFCLPSWFQESPELAVKKYLVKQITSPSLVKYIFIMFLSLSRAHRPLQIAHVEDLFPQSLFVTPKEL